MLRKLFKALLNQNHQSSYKKYSSSDAYRRYNHRKQSHRGHGYYKAHSSSSDSYKRYNHSKHSHMGHGYYKKRRKSSGFFSSFFSS